MSDIDLDFTGDAESVLPVRKCAICNKPLSRYNTTGRCFFHPDPDLAERQRQRDALRLRAVSKAEGEELRALAVQTKQESLARLAKEKLVEGEEERVRQGLIFDLVCQEFSLSREEIVQPGRKTLFVEARQVLMYLLYQDTSLSYPAIGELLGGRDHTTVMYGVTKIETELESDAMLALRIERIRSSYQPLD